MLLRARRSESSGGVQLRRLARLRLLLVIGLLITSFRTTTAALAIGWWTVLGTSLVRRVLRCRSAAAT